MSQLQQTLAAVSSLLCGAGRAWALAGGLAVSARVEPRFTRDVDVVVAVPDDPTAEDVVRSFRAAGYEVFALVEQEAMRRLAAARLRAEADGDEGPIVDLLFASSGVEAEVVEEAEETEVFPGLVAPLPRVGHLLALKILSYDAERRPQDGVDIQALLSAADRGELERARAALTLIQQRGYHRQRELVALLDERLERHRTS